MRRTRGQLVDGERARALIVARHASVCGGECRIDVQQAWPAVGYSGADRTICAWPRDARARAAAATQPHQLRAGSPPVRLLNEKRCELARLPATAAAVAAWRGKRLMAVSSAASSQREIMIQLACGCH